MPSRKGKGYENKAKNLCQSDLKNKKIESHNARKNLFTALI